MLELRADGSAEYLRHDGKQWKSAIYSKGPVTFRFKDEKSFELYSGGERALLSFTILNATEDELKVKFNGTDVTFRRVK
jgi:hypothetical protein